MAEYTESMCWQFQYPYDVNNTVGNTLCYLASYQYICTLDMYTYVHTEAGELHQVSTPRPKNNCRLNLLPLVSNSLAITSGR